jgi:hypothetical protein
MKWIYLIFHFSWREAFQIILYFINQTIRTAYSAEIIWIYSFQPQPSIKSLESLEIIRLPIFPLRSIIKDENINSDILVIFDQFYKIQLSSDPEYSKWEWKGDELISEYILRFRLQRAFFFNE